MQEFKKETSRKATVQIFIVEFYVLQASLLTVHYST